MKRFSMKVMVITVIMLLTVGCLTNHVPEMPTTVDPPAVEIGVEDVSRRVLGNNARIKRAATDTATTTELIDASTNDPNIHKYSRVIRKNSNDQIKVARDNDEAVLQLAELSYELSKLKNYIDEVDNSNRKLVKENKKLKDEIAEFEERLSAVSLKAAERTQWIWLGVTALCAVGLVLGIVTFIYGARRIGLGLAMASLVIAPIAYFMSAYIFIVAIVGGVILFGFLGVMAYMFYTHRKALVESVGAFEITKRARWKDVKDKVSTIQSRTTKKLVSEIKVDKDIKDVPK